MKVRACVTMLALAVFFCSVEGRAGDPRLTLDAGIDFLRDVPLHKNDQLLAVVEAPAGTRDRWRVDTKTGMIVWRNSQGNPKRLAFPLGYPANTGFFPGTIAPPPHGNGRSPLRLFLLGDPLPTGSIVPVKPLGVLKLDEGGERSSIIIAAPSSMVPFDGAMDDSYAGASTVLVEWLKNYRGPGKISLAIESESAAAQMAIDQSTVQEN